MSSPANIIDMKLGIVFLIPILSFFIINNNKVYISHIISFILFSLGVFLIIIFLSSLYSYRGEINIIKYILHKVKQNLSRR